LKCDHNFLNTLIIALLDLGLFLISNSEGLNFLAMQSKDDSCSLFKGISLGKDFIDGLKKYLIILSSIE
jgi:hypothetical protein